VNHRQAGSPGVDDQYVEHQNSVATATLALVMIAAIVALLLNVLALDVPGRSLLAIVSVLTVPGLPIALALPIPSRHVQFVLGIALSLAGLLIISTIQLLSGAWSPLAAQLILVMIGLIATVFAARGTAAR